VTDSDDEEEEEEEEEEKEEEEEEMVWYIPFITILFIHRSGR